MKLIDKDTVVAEIERRINNIIRTPEEEAEVKRDSPDQYGIILGYRAALSILDKAQPKREWSEEDEDILNTIINHFKVDIECTDEDDMVRWLKSLKPQNRWKPSEEQMKCLDNVKGSDDHNGYVLNTLYNDLKKLREE